MRPATILPACGIAVALAVTGCSALDSSSTTTPPPGITEGTTAPPSATPAKATPSAAKKPTAKKADPSDECEARPNASGDIFVRMLSPGVAWYAQRLGGEWGWDATTHQCLTSVQMMIATAPTVPGSCTQVALASSNPGYDENATPAAPLEKVIAQAGPAC